MHKCPQEPQFPSLEEGHIWQDYRRLRLLQSREGDANPEVRARPLTSRATLVAVSCALWALLGINTFTLVRVLAFFTPRKAPQIATCGNLLLAAGTDSDALPHDEEGPCAGHRGILFSLFFDLCLPLFFVVSLGFWVFLFSNGFQFSLHGFAI
jgi:hypothetical protein